MFKFKVKFKHYKIYNKNILKLYFLKSQFNLMTKTYKTTKRFT